MTIYHTHHIIPRHAGGTDDPSNLVRLTIEEHAAAHKKLFEEDGRWQDELAWKMISGMITEQELIYEKQRQGGLMQRGKKRSAACIEENRIRHLGANHHFFGKTHSAETLLKMKKPKSEQTKINMRKPKTEKHRKAISDARKNVPWSVKDFSSRIATCVVCGTTTIKTNITRYHKNCTR